MTKINNFHTMRMIMKVLAAAILVIFLVLTCIPLNITVKLILFTTGAVLLRLFLKSKCIEYEYSGECITIKRFHPLYQRKMILPFAEFPRHLLKDFVIEERQMVSSLVIVLDTERRKGIKMKLQIAGFNDRQMKDLIDSLENIKKTNKNEY